jgi:hypothetical protein
MIKKRYLFLAQRSPSVTIYELRKCQWIGWLRIGERREKTCRPIGLRYCIGYHLSLMDIHARDPFREWETETFSV